MSEKFKVERGIPIPPKKGPGKEAKYPFAQMDIGDSVFVKNGEAPVISSAAKYYAFRLNRKFTVRGSDDGVRVWRTE